MTKSDAISKYKILCIVIAIGFSLFGILLGISLNLNSHDVLASYRSSAKTLECNNKALETVVDAAWQGLIDIAFESKDSTLFRQMETLSDQSAILHYLDSLRAAFILWVDGEQSEQIQRQDEVSSSTYFMIDLGNARELHKRLQQYQDQLNSYIGNSQDSIDFNLQDQYSYGEKVSWEVCYFSNAMAVEVVNQLDLIKQQLLIAEWSVYRSLIKAHKKTNNLYN